MDIVRAKATRAVHEKIMLSVRPLYIRIDGKLVATFGYDILPVESGNVTY